MVSEWEELEKLTKDELIIELMKERFAHREINQRLRMIIDYDYPIIKETPCVIEEEDAEDWHPGYKTSEDWARKIMLYAFKKHNGDIEDFHDDESFIYGLDWDQAEEVFNELVKEGKIPKPKEEGDE